jgi:hypothetical protein
MTVAGLVVAVSLLVLSGCSLERWDAVVEVKVPGDAVPGEWVRLDGTPYRVVQAETAKVARIRVGIYFSPAPLSLRPGTVAGLIQPAA